MSDSGCPVLAPMPYHDYRATIVFSFRETLAATARRFLLILGALVVGVDAGSFFFRVSDSSTVTAIAVLVAIIVAFGLSYHRGDARGIFARERPASGIPSPALVANHVSQAAGKFAA
jgi:hypothetical protein